MATLLLSAAGAAIGSGFGGTVLGMSGAVIGRAIGGVIGRGIDQRLMGSGSEPVNIGQIDRIRLTGASEGAPIAQVWGRMRVAGQVIWATEFQEHVTRRRSGKGAPQPEVRNFSYTVSLAVALCAGEILKVGRIWADGSEIAPSDLNLRVYRGDESQLPDPRIETVEGTGLAPAYRGTAYVVIEDLDVSQYGNRVPQFTFEVFRPAQGAGLEPLSTLSEIVRGVALIPGTGEYALATTPVHFNRGPGRNESANVHSASGTTDFALAYEQLTGELPEVQSVSLVVSWFGNDLRCDSCQIQPKVEQTILDGVGMAWRAGGIARNAAATVQQVSGRPIYGGTPADQSVVEAIQAIRASGREVMFYPFVLMEQIEGNTLPDPWSGQIGQPALPWRGRITTSLAPGRPGTPDRTASAELEVSSFFGTADANDFSVQGTTVSYSGPAEWSYRRFILHYAKLCAAAGGVDAFCIGSEMRSLTQVRGANDSFPAVSAMVTLASEVRAILGANCKISYAADWSEFANYQANGNVYFHLDPLWSSADIDFIGIDNYMPLSDWRDEEGHADASWKSIYDLGYLRSNVAGGEYYDWYYDSPEGEKAQVRRAVVDEEYGEPWVFRAKDLLGWWSNPHHDRLNGVRAAVGSAWVPKSKPFRFTEYGCAAIDKGANQPNRFLDLQSSESGLPRASNGQRDDLIQMQYLRAMAQHWNATEHNPISPIYGTEMVDMAHAHVWAWDARPFPAFPGLSDLWDDAKSYSRGHWLNGRATNQPLDAVVREICSNSGPTAVSTSSLFGLVRGYRADQMQSGRAMLEPLLLTAGADVVDRDGELRFASRLGNIDHELEPNMLAVTPETDGYPEVVRGSDLDVPDAVQLSYLSAQSDYEVQAAEARFPDAESQSVSSSEVPMVLTEAEANGIAHRWLAEAAVARESMSIALPPSRTRVRAGDTVLLGGAKWRLDRVEHGDALSVEAVRIEAGVYRHGDFSDEGRAPRRFAAPVPLYPVFLDLPLISGEEVPHAPHLAVAAEPWPGPAGLWSSPSDAAFELNRVIAAPAIIGITETDLPRTRPGVWDRGAPLRVRITGEGLSSSGAESVLNGANAMAIGDGTAANWEVIQFQQAQLVAPDTYELSLRLRGQAGTDGTMPTIWPAGSTVVLLDKTVTQIDLASSARGLQRNYRIGELSRGPSSPAIVPRSEAFDGIGLRPYSVCHLRASGVPGSTVMATWIRRSRLDGDSWLPAEIPLSEDTEAYQVRITSGTSILAEYQVTTPVFTYPAAAQAADGVTGSFGIAVAQISTKFGPGPFRTVAVTL